MIDKLLNYGRYSFSFVGLPLSWYLQSILSQAWNKGFYYKKGVGCVGYWKSAYSNYDLISSRIVGLFHLKSNESFFASK